MPPSDPKCAATTKGGQPCPLAARHGAFCWRHDPAQADHRRAVGRIRHTRFVASIGGQEFDRAKVPTVARLVDRILDLERALATCTDIVKAKIIDLRLKALLAARDTLWGERDRLHKGNLDPASPNVIVPQKDPEAPAWLRPVQQ